MTANSNDGDARRALYERFHSAVGRSDTRGGDDIYFDEDDIIEIYDYANDINDDLIKMEALFYGARMFPGSEALRTRREYLYYYLGNDKAARLMLDRHNSRSTLSRLLALRTRPDNRKAAHAELESILNDAGELDDEELIQFIAEGSTQANYPWLIQHVDEIKKHCTYLPTLYYELAGAAEDNGDYATAVKMAEELTMLEPFNAEFWVALAEVQAMSNDYPAALNSVDYALAIDPDSPRAKIVKASALYYLKTDADEAIKLLLEAKGSDRFDSAALQTLTVLLTNRSRLDEAIAAIKEFLDKSPSDIMALDCLFVLDEDCVSPRMEQFAETEMASQLAPNVWIDWTARHLAGNRCLTAAKILLTARSCGIADNSLDAMIAEALYRAGLYEDVLREVDASEKASPERAAARVMALIRLGRRSEAEAYLGDYMAGAWLTHHVFANDILPYSAPARRFYTLGVQGIFRTILNVLAAPEEIPADDYDPFI